MSEVLFVCTANICRSAYAEVRTRALAPTLAVESAGVYGWVDHPIDGPIGTVAAERGADPAPFRSRRLRLPMVRDAALVLTAEVKHRTAILDDLPSARARVHTIGQFADSLGSAPAELRGEELIAWMGALRRRDHARFDVPDPYRRGPEAAVATADTIDRYLAVILPRLA